MYNKYNEEPNAEHIRKWRSSNDKEDNSEFWKFKTDALHDDFNIAEELIQAKEIPLKYNINEYPIKDYIIYLYFMNFININIIILFIIFLAIFIYYLKKHKKVRSFKFTPFKV